MKNTLIRHLTLGMLGLLGLAYTASAETVIAGNELEGIQYVKIEEKSVPGVTFLDKEQQFNLPLPAAKQDWASASSVTIRLYSPAASGAGVWIMFRDAADPKGPKEFPSQYWHFVIKPDWVGWKDLVIPFSKLTATRVTGTPAKISQIVLRNKFGPSNPAENKFGIPVPLPGTWGIETITVK
jgi:hypothetical protein